MEIYSRNNTYIMFETCRLSRKPNNMYQFCYLVFTAYFQRVNAVSAVAVGPLT